MKRRETDTFQIPLRLLTLALSGACVLLSNQGADCGGFPPWTPLRPWGPESTAVGRTETYASQSYSRRTEKWRIIFKWTDTTKLDTTDWLSDEDTATMAKKWTRVGTFSVRALAQDEIGKTSLDWSDSLPVVVLPDTFRENALRAPGRVDGSPHTMKPTRPDTTKWSL